MLAVTTSQIFATDQIPDFLIYKGDTLPIHVNPLESYFEDRCRPDSIFEKYGDNSTASLRGYTGYWELRNDSLFLIELRGMSEKIKLSLIFSDRKTDTKIFADWVDFSILNSYGELIYAQYPSFASIYEYEREFFFSKGILTKIIKYNNQKSHKSKFADNPELLNKYLKENINYLNIPNLAYEKAHVFVRISKVTEDGKIDSVEVVKSFDSTLNNEAIRVVKSIPDWDVFYTKGQQIQIRYYIKVTFQKPK